MNRVHTVLILCLIGFAVPVVADGLMRPANPEAYPYDFLRHRMTRVTVTIHGLVAETVVYQEFENECHDSTDAVYAFPLPPEARATAFLYWRNDTTFKAILKVRQQVPNPGTGEGGIAALVNQYIGRNGIRIELKGIAPGAIQRVELHYVSRCDYFRGEHVYRFPLATGEFVKHPLDHLEFSFDVQTNSDIVSYNIPTHPEYRELQFDPRHLRLEMIAPKSYLAGDLEFRFQTNNTALGVDFYSVANDTMDGHYALFVRPQDEAAMSETLPKRVVFLLGNSSRMLGYKLESSLAAISQALDLLSDQDYFNILVFNSSVQSWQGQTVRASTQNRASARQFLEGIAIQYGTRMDLGLQSALAQFHNDSLNNAIVVFTDGRSPIDPRAIAAQNKFKAGIFAIAIGDDLDRARLEMTSALNYGFVTYFRESDNLIAGMLQVFEQINQPVLKGVGLEFGRANVHQRFPPTLPSTYAGSYFFVTGRYRNSGLSSLSIAGHTLTGETAYDFQLDFSNQTTGNKFAENLWAKEAIDALEREIEVYGETPALKDSLIAISLRYGIRCRYTAYIADYENVVVPTTVGENHNMTIAPTHPYLISNYPNPFNPETRIVYVLPIGPVRVRLLIYDLNGRLIRVLVDALQFAGLHEVKWDGRDALGRDAASGVYIYMLEVGEIVITKKMTLMR